MTRVPVRQSFARQLAYCKWGVGAMEMARSILETFEFEENTIFHVENWLVHNGIKLNRTEIKKKLSDFLLMGLLRLYDDPSKGQTHFQDSSDEFEEDYWFVLTEAGKKKLIELS